MVRGRGHHTDNIRGMGRTSVSMQIEKIILYSHRGESREVAFKIGGLNILTGASKTGKSAIIDIIDYCLGRGECHVADGVIRKYVGWYGLMLRVADGRVFIARRNPAIGEKSSGDVYLERGGSGDGPAFAALVKNMTVSALEKFVGATLGISENKHQPQAFTREPLEANARHALLFCFQDQNDIDSKIRLFHRQGEDFMSQAIKDTLPYFLGAIDEERLLKQSQLEQAAKALRQLERQKRDAEAVDDSNFPRARVLFEEGKQTGLIDERAQATSYEALLEILQAVAHDDRVRDDLIVGDGEDTLAALRLERQGLRGELERVNADIRSARLFSSETTGYEREAKEQRARLSSVGLLQGDGASVAHCPLCETPLVSPMPTIVEINESLSELGQQLEAVQAENPRLQARLASLQAEQGAVDAKLRENQELIKERVRENEILKGQQDGFVLRARTIGKIVQYLETASHRKAGSSLDRQIDAARARVAALEAELDLETVKERIDGYLNIIGRYMTDYSSALDLEHVGSQLRLDIRNLTVVADTLDGPVPLYRMGSGENWVGYHVLAHLALHKWFRQKERPVPAFLLFDQPSQAHYPAERDAEGSLSVLADEDQAAVHKLFKLIADTCAELSPSLQVIVMDHADINADWFKSAVVERWRGRKLIPEEWQREL